MEVRTKPSKPQEVTLMLHTNEHIIKHKIGLLNLAEELGNVSKACQVMGLSRDTFYRYKQAVEEWYFGGILDTHNFSNNSITPLFSCPLTRYSVMNSYSY
jgi:hypothetical protein